MLLGCAIRDPEPVGLTPPLAPDLTVTRGLVWLEDQCEDPEQDAQTVTLSEGFHDALMAPLNLTLLAVMTPIVIVVSIVDGLRLGSAAATPANSQKRVQRIAQWLPFSFAGPDPFAMEPDATIPPAHIWGCGREEDGRSGADGE